MSLPNSLMKIHVDLSSLYMIVVKSYIIVKFEIAKQTEEKREKIRMSNITVTQAVNRFLLCNQCRHHYRTRLSIKITVNSIMLYDSHVS